ncbi:MAG: glycoside hydrolase family 2, partial [Armatimonadetes bacterium]|nr:glycoside hydrolase family 2 [Armatimonadota bacterium]
MAAMVISLNGQWLLGTDPANVGRDEQWWNAPTAEARPAKVPWIIQDAFPGYHGVAWYWRDFEAPKNPHPGGRTLLRFWAVDYLAEV